METAASGVSVLRTHADENFIPTFDFAADKLALITWPSALLLALQAVRREPSSSFGQPAPLDGAS